MCFNSLRRVRASLCLSPPNGDLGPPNVLAAAVARRTCYA
jgi:hypothetical protein